MNQLESPHGNTYVTWDAFPAERRSGGIRASKPMGIVSMAWNDAFDGNAGDCSRKSVEVPSDVAKRLASIRKAQPEDSEVRYDDLVDMVMQTQRQVAKERIMRLANRRDYSRHELEERLAREGYDSNISTEVLDDFVACGIVSDERFAEVYARSKVSAGWGTERIVRELDLRGIDVNDLMRWPYDFMGPDAEFERAMMVAQKKCSGSRRLTYQQVVRFLMGRGFSYNVARGAAREVV